LYNHLQEQANEEEEDWQELVLIYLLLMMKIREKNVDNVPILEMDFNVLKSNLMSLVTHVLN